MAMARIHTIISSTSLLITLGACAQYSSPESVEYDAANDRYLVSNTGDQTIKQRAQDGTVTAFAATSGSPYGIEIVGDAVYACVGGTIQGFALSDGAQVFDLDLGASFLNGITSDGTYLYATDFSTKKVYKVDIAASTYSVLVSNTISTPNGIIWDAAASRLVMVSWGSNAAIRSVDPGTGALAVLVTTSLANIDGIAIDCTGGFLVSSWSPARITRFDHDFAAPGTDLGITGLSSPADICFDPAHHLVCIPGGGTVRFEEVDCSNAVADAPGYTTVNAVPNPTDGLVRIDLPLAEPEPFMVFNARGMLVASGTLRPHAQLSVSELESGVYLIDLPHLKRYVRVVKR